MRVRNRDESTVGRPISTGQEDGPAAEDARDRIRRARRAGRPAWLWPEIPVAEWRAALVTIENTARALLTGSKPAAIVARDGAAERALGLASYTSGMGPWLAWHIERGELPADARAERLLAEHLDHARSRWVRLEVELAAVLQALTDAGIAATVLKGAYGALRWFAEPALRPLSDIDILVAREDIARSAQVLHASGYVEQTALRSAQHSTWRRRGAAALPHSLMFVHADNPIDVDLHGSLDIDFFGIAVVRFGAPDAAFLDRARIGGTATRVLEQPMLAAHHAVHASHGTGLTLIRLTELSLMLRHDMKTAADWARLGALLRDLRAERFAWPALTLTEQLVPGSVDALLLSRCAAASPARLRRVIGAMRPATTQRLDGLAFQERYMWAHGVREHVRRTVTMLAPTARGGSVRRLGRIYLDRAYQLLRGRVTWSARRDHP